MCALVLCSWEAAGAKSRGTQFQPIDSVDKTSSARSSRLVSRPRNRESNDQILGRVQLASHLTRARGNTSMDGRMSNECTATVELPVSSTSYQMHY
ncbi:hypothetical protein AcV5_009513 [Taiwanofungus camphoratus]|nr:hypothetical protein AcV5_009513 [Antrodia cinnamomea]